MTLNSNQSQFSFKVGQEVSHKNTCYVITLIESATHVLIKNKSTHATERVCVFDLANDQRPSENSKVRRPDLTTIPAKEWEQASKRLDIINPLLSKPSRTYLDVIERAEQTGYGPATIYRWIKQYESTGGQITSLLKRQRSDRGQGRLTPDVEGIVSDAIEIHYLSKQKKSIRAVSDQVATRCIDLGVKPPHPNTIRNRILTLPEEVREIRRKGTKAAAKFKPIRGKFPGANWPLATVQIDHTKLDLILVDEKYRRAIGRPYITLAIDVYSRMVSGYYLSLDAPNSFSVAMCVARSIVPKNKTTGKYNTQSDWPVYGVMDNIHVDNGKDFRAEALRRACDEYGITLQWRPVATPRYGGHVERFFRTLAEEIHALPGSTSSNVIERGEYNSEKESSLTIREFEKWLVNYIVNIYHHKIHSGIKDTPYNTYQNAIIGKGECLERGLPPIPTNPDRILLDFMPFKERTIQPYGISIENIKYYSHELRPWICASVKPNSKIKRKFVVRYNPTDMSHVFFYDPKEDCYYSIPYRDNTNPPASLWEIRAAAKKIREDGASIVNEKEIFRAYNKMQKIVEKSAKEKKKARRNSERIPKKINVSSPGQTTKPSVPRTTAPHKRRKMKPFKDIRE